MVTHRGSNVYAVVNNVHGSNYALMFETRAAREARPFFVWDARVCLVRHLSTAIDTLVASGTSTTTCGPGHRPDWKSAWIPVRSATSKQSLVQIHPLLQIHSNPSSVHSFTSIHSWSQAGTKQTASGNARKHQTLWDRWPVIQVSVRTDGLLASLRSQCVPVITIVRLCTGASLINVYRRVWVGGVSMFDHFECYWTMSGDVVSYLT